MPDTRHPDIPAILQNATTVAVVGLSDNPMRSSYGIAMVLKQRGYTVIPVNPKLTEWNGLQAYPDLASVPQSIDIVNVFRRSEHLAGIVEDAITVRAKVLWTQLGVVDLQAAEKARRHGLEVVLDRCIAVELSLNR